jgi:very-short-patch-repair endonuclease
MMKPDYGMPMYYGAKPKLFEFAKRMRYAPTEAEKLMWQILTGDEFRQHKFRRQHPIAKYIADFYSHLLVFVVEIDGGYHLEPAQKEFDDFRDEDMHQLGIRVMRFTNDEVIHAREKVIRKLSDYIAQTSQSS